MDSTLDPFCSVPECRDAAHRDGLCVEHRIVAAVLAERETCAKLAETIAGHPGDRRAPLDVGLDIAAAIRARNIRARK